MTCAICHVQFFRCLPCDFGIPRILKAYGEECFKFTYNFIRITFPVTAHDVAHDHTSDHVSVQVKKTDFCFSRRERTFGITGIVVD